MWDGIPDPQRFDAAIRRSHRKKTKATFTNLYTGQQRTLPVKEGDVTEDANSNVRRTLNLTLPAQEELWRWLDTVGAQIVIEQTLRYVDGRSDTVPLGRFVLDSDDFDYGPGGSLTTSSAPDLWGKVQKDRMRVGQRASVRTNTIWQEVKRLVEGAFNTASPFPGWAQLDTSVTAKVGPLVWDDGDRDAAISDLLKAHSLECFFDREGMAVLRPEPVITAATKPLWLVNAGQTGVLVGARRTRDRTKVRNAIEVVASAGDAVFATQVVAITDPTDELRITGTLGYQAETLSLPTIRSSAQARAAGKTRLAKTAVVGRQLSLEAVGNPLIDAGDPGIVGLPNIDRSTPRPTELCLADIVSHPFAPAGTQSITTRSTRPDSDDEATA